MLSATNCSGVQQTGGWLVAEGHGAAPLAGGSPAEGPSPMPGPSQNTLSSPAGAGSLRVCASGLHPFPSLLLPVSGCWPSSPAAGQGEPVPHTQLPLLTLLASLPQTSPALPLLQVTTRCITRVDAHHPHSICRPKRI